MNKFVYNVLLKTGIRRIICLVIVFLIPVSQLIMITPLPLFVQFGLCAWLGWTTGSRSEKVWVKLGVIKEPFQVLNL